MPAFYFKGGFNSVFEEQKKERQEAAKKRRLELEKFQFDVKNTKRIYKTYWWTIGFTLVGFGYLVIRLVAWLFLKEGG